MFTFNASHELNQMAWLVVFAILIGLLIEDFGPGKNAFELEEICKEVAQGEVHLAKRARPACHDNCSSDLQGSKIIVPERPRALPWAITFSPVGAG